MRDLMLVIFFSPFLTVNSKSNEKRNGKLFHLTGKTKWNVFHLTLVKCLFISIDFVLFCLFTLKFIRKKMRVCLSIVIHLIFSLLLRCFSSHPTEEFSPTSKNLKFIRKMTQIAVNFILNPNVYLSFTSRPQKPNQTGEEKFTIWFR